MWQHLCLHRSNLGNSNFGQWHLQRSSFGKQSLGNSILGKHNFFFSQQPWLLQHG